jgi:flagellar hook-length control protein FliK
MTDSSLAGRIFVENQTVKDVFQANMDGLMQAFKDGGWSNLSLQVSVGGGGGNQAGQQQPAPQARDYDRQVAQTVTDSRTDRVGSWNDRQVDLTA